MSATLPQSTSLDLISADTPSHVPLERWDVDWFTEVSPSKLEPHFGSFIQGAELFDGTMFRISRLVQSCDRKELMIERAILSHSVTAVSLLPCMNSQDRRNLHGSAAPSALTTRTWRVVEH